MSATGALALGGLLLAAATSQGTPKVAIGSKGFTESVILGELASQLARNAGANALHRRELGGTRVLWNALLSGEIDLYPEYTGTLLQELVPAAGHDLGGLRKALGAVGIGLTSPLGFNNTYAIGVKRALAQRENLRTLSDLARQPKLKLGFSHEFVDRKDGWPALRKTYGLPQTSVRGLEHDLAYRALNDGAIDATDLYSTDAEIQFYDLAILEDDRRAFPEYQAVFLYRADLAERAPEVVAALQQLEGLISAPQMIAMNAEAKLRRVPESQIATEFLSRTLGLGKQAQAEGWPSRILRRTREHLVLVGVSLAIAILVAVPLGILSARRRRLGALVLAAVGIVQTVPSLALLVFMIPLLGIGERPAIVALFLYSLLPIVRNTFSGLRGIPLEIRESAEALGLPPGARLWRVDLPLASPAILAGIKTSAVINVGTATLGALIGAGGYGQPILSGIRLADTALILEGAVPAAALALLAQGLFELAERLLVPRGLRLQRSAR